MKTKTTLIYLLAFSFLLFGCKKEDPNKHKADVIIYGGTSAAITAAVEVIKNGKTVIIVSPDKHLGGLTSSGLGFTDTGNKSIIGGLARDFYQRIYTYYQSPETWKHQKKEEYGNVGQGTPAMDGANKTMWIFEPSIAEKVFEDYVKEYKIEVHRNEWLDRENGVTMEGGKIMSIRTLNGQTYEGQVFMDVTYEGDLMAAAGVKYHVGREANSVYNETWNGIQVGVLHHGHHFGDRKISPYVVANDPESGLLPRISSESPGIKGEGDSKIQAYCFRMCLTQDENNKVPFEKPANYEAKQYELILRVFDSGWRETFDKYDPIPNHKTDVNNHGPFSTDNIGMNYDYPDATYERRAEIIKEHENYQKGLLYFIANDPRVPEDVQSEMKKWGYAKDEFTDNGNFPHQIYVREARRMLGDFVMTENEIQGLKPVTRPIGMGSYTMDSHNIQRYVTEDGYVQNEGDIGVHPHQPYSIDLGTILPKKEECTNLLVPVAVSSSHIAFGSIRMEPVFMILGQSAGLMAAMAIDKKMNLADIPYADIKIALEKEGQILIHKTPE